MSSPTTAEDRRLLTVIPAIMLVVVAGATLAILLGTAALRNWSPSGRVAAASSAPTTHLTLDILPVRPGGPAENWPAYMPTSSTNLPANSVITVTIRNFDLGDDSLPAGSPLLSVQGRPMGARRWTASPLPHWMPTTSPIRSRFPSSTSTCRSRVIRSATRAS